MPAPSKLTDEVRVKLQEAAAIGASVGEMAYYCNVSRQTIYEWMKNDPELSDKIERLREKPVLEARKRVVEGISESYSNAMDYLSRKKKTEMSQRQEHTGEGGGAITLKWNDSNNDTLHSTDVGEEVPPEQ